MEKWVLPIQAGVFLLQAWVSFKNARDVRQKKQVALLRYALDVTFLAEAILLVYSFSGLYSKLILAGIIFSIIGDVIMADTFRLKNRLILGMASFSITHVLYICAFINLMSLNGVKLVTILPYTIIFYVLITLIVYITSIKNLSAGAAVNIAALVYAMLVSIMAAFGAATGISLGGYWILLAPATALFVFSDAIIALIEIGRHKIPKGGWLIWVTYSAAQIGIILSGIL